MQFEREYTIGAREIGKNNSLTNLGILAFLEDIAGLHSDSVGYGVKDIETKKRAWILMEWKVKVLKRLEFAKKIKVKTWARTIQKERFFTYRDFEIRDENNEIVAIATTKWVFIDTEKGKISKIGFDLINLYNPENKCVFDIEDIEKLTIPEKTDKVTIYKTKRADIDVNNHMHNLNYLSLAYEALPDDVYEKPECNNLRITYKHQIKLGDVVKCCYSFVDGKHMVIIKSEDESIIHAIVQLT